VIDVDCGDCYAVVNVIGRPFFRSSDDHNGEQSPYITPWDSNGGEMSKFRFNNVSRKIGQPTSPWRT